ncbi:MAG: hypothetical protein WCA85_12805 [Paraburkholderia sp.]|uniref:HNH endonuclease n=1 Tax=Paraburkholderia sp. TaxID=1926495 RepID=UPI003C5B3374
MDKHSNEWFTAFLREKAAEAKRDLKYDPRQFLSMLGADGGYLTVAKLVGGKNPSDGFVKLWESGRLDLSVEALVLETEWIRFFDEQLLKEAERKLKGAGYRYVRYVAAESSERLPADVLKKATPEYIWKSVQLFHSGDVSHAFGSSTKYDLIAENGKRFAPKAVFGVALSMALDGAAIEPKHFSGDEASLCFALLRDAGYQIVPKDSDSPSSDPASMPEQEWMEGDRKLVSHLRRERSTGLAKAKKAQFRRLHGKLTCERCKLDPVAAFGTEHAEACIEVHHSTTHVRQMGSQHKTTLDDVQCLCANCHRLLHRLLREEDKVHAHEDT